MNVAWLVISYAHLLDIIFLGPIRRHGSVSDAKPSTTTLPFLCTRPQVAGN